MFTKKQTTKAAPPMRFNLRDATPDYDKLAELCATLRAALSKLDSEESELLTRLSYKAAKPHTGVSAKVAELLGDDVDETPDPLSEGIRTRLTEINALRRDTRAALDIATERLQRARHAASKVICEGAKDDYLARVRKLADALIAAHEANASLCEITTALDSADVAWTGLLPPAPANRMLGAAYDRQNRVAVWLKDAAADGLIDKKSIPQGLTQ
ncbi:hypothetical protein [Mesorhizobium helmanticense]|uniref:Uncharacterized protein n=1 Tax=Mesorhizobium helmanticense TaxID=1776423 RepID=A0A2T4IRD8_9HYPH|nr:hypothetical protein [Mesorhizobium helmanticense]PTE08214.1 hypothetical protein C9427_21440 [Mesorhizobium helmanticense]